jgi:hypothetical protein
MLSFGNNTSGFIVELFSYGIKNVDDSSTVPRTTIFSNIDV